jgi:hypothetical protein
MSILGLRRLVFRESCELFQALAFTIRSSYSSTIRAVENCQRLVAIDRFMI